MASYQTPYDKDSYISRGYDLPKEAIMGAIAARSNYWMQGAQEIKNQYQNTFDFNLTNEQNKANLKAQKDQADQQLKGLVKTDLSIGDNVSSALKLFDPIVKNENYIYDDHLTKQVQSGLQQAQSDLKRKGSDHFNMKSVQVLNDTLQDWKHAKPEDIDMYLNDSLGTTYQPYDPKIDKDFQDKLSKRVKNGRIKKDIQDGHGNIITTEWSDINSIQGQEWVRQSRPQQQEIQDALDAKIFTNRLRKADPQEREQLVNHIESLKTYNSQKQASYIEAEKHKMELNYQLRPEDEKAKSKGEYTKQLEVYNEAINNAKNQYAKFDNQAYFDPHKKNIAENQLQTLYSQRNINGVVDGLGLDNISQTIKKDGSYWEGQQLAFNYKKLEHEDAYRAAKLQLEASKIKKGEEGTTGENPNVAPALALSSTGTNGLSGEDATEVIGKETQKRLKGEIEAKQSDNIAGLFGQLGVTVSSSTGYGNTDFFSAINENSQVKLSELTDRLMDSSGNNKKLIYALINEGAKKSSGGKLFKESTLPNLKAFEAKMYIKEALSDPKLFNQAIKTAGLNSGDYNAANTIGYMNSTLEADKKNQAKTYLKPYRDAASLILPNANQLSFEDLKNLDEDAYVKTIAPELLKSGFNQSDIKDFTQALKENKSLKESLVYEHGIPHLVHNSLNPHLGKLVDYQDKWNSYQKTLNTKLADISKGASNYNTVPYKLTEKTDNDKSFNPDIHYNSTQFRNIINQNTSNADISGVTAKSGYVEKLKEVVNKHPDLIDGFNVYYDGKDQFIIPSVDLTDKAKKALKDIGIDPTDLVNTRIHVDKTTLSSFRVKPLSQDELDFSHNKIFESKLQSGKTTSFYNIGGNKPKFEGSFMSISPDTNGAGFAIKEMPFSTFVNSDLRSTQPKNYYEAAIKAGNYLGKFIYDRDSDAVKLMDILDKYKIDYKNDKFLSLKDLPQEVKEEIKNKNIQIN